MEIKNFVKTGKINAFLNFNNIFSLDNDSLVIIKDNYISQSVLDYISSITNCEKDRIEQSLHLVNLSSNIFSQNMQTLSSSEKLKVELAIFLILNKEQIILYQFDKYFMEKDLLFFKKMFQKLVLKYNKTIILIESNFSFMLNFVDHFIWLNNDEVKTFNKEDIYDDEIAKYIKLPDIVDFVKYINKDKKILDNYTDIKELIKAIYREV